MAQAQRLLLAEALAWSALTWSRGHTMGVPQASSRLPPYEPGSTITNENIEKSEPVKESKTIVVDKSSSTNNGTEIKPVEGKANDPIQEGQGGPPSPGGHPQCHPV